MDEYPVSIKEEDSILSSESVSQQLTLNLKQTNHKVTEWERRAVMDEKPVSIKMGDYISSSTDFSFYLKPVEPAAVEVRVKKENVENDVIYELVPSRSTEDEKREMKVESVATLSADVVSPDESTSHCFNSSLWVADVTIKEEEDLGVYFEEEQESRRSVMNEERVNIEKEDSILSSNNFSFNLKPVGFVALDKVKKEVVETDAAHELAPSSSTEDKIIEIKAEKIDFSLSDLVSPVQNTPLCTSSSLVDADVVMKKEEDLGVWFEEEQESALSGRSFSWMFDNEEGISWQDTHQPIIEQKQRSCIICAATFMTEDDLRQHLTIHLLLIKRKQYSRSDCNVTFTTMKDRREHEISHLPPAVQKQLSCIYCAKTFMTKSVLRRHTNTHLPSRKVKQYSCFRCPATFMSVKDCHAHMITHLPKKKQLSCVDCDATFMTKVGLLHHVTTHPSNKQKKHSCTHCAATFMTLKDRLEHMIIHHPISKQKQLSCVYCAATFIFDDKFEEHLYTHIPSRKGEGPEGPS